MKPGTRVKVAARGLFGDGEETATIARQLAEPGRYQLRFADGSTMAAHVSDFRIDDPRQRGPQTLPLF